MADLPPTLSASGPSSSEAAGTSTSETRASSSADVDPSKINVLQLIAALHDDTTRETALRNLNKVKGNYADLALLLWNSAGSVFDLLKEVLAVYRFLSSPDLTDKVSRRVCDALALLQCIALHPETRISLMKARIPVYLYPLLNDTNLEKHYEHIRLTCLGVIGALVKPGDAESIHFVLETEVLPHCLRCMDLGKVLSKTVATFIVHKILSRDEGLKYCCSYAQRFYAVCNALRNVLESVAQERSELLLKHALGCYLNLSRSPRACDGLRHSFPDRLRDPNIVNILQNDQTAMEWLQQLYHNVAIGPQGTTVPKELLERMAQDNTG